MRAGQCSRALPGRSRRAGAALLASLALGTLPSAARAQDEAPGGIQLPTPAQTELPEVKVVAPKVEPPKPPPKPAVAQKPTRRQEAVAPHRVAAPKSAVAAKPAAAPVPLTPNHLPEPMTLGNMRELGVQLLISLPTTPVGTRR